MTNESKPNWEKPILTIKMKNGILETLYYVALFGVAGIEILIAAGKIEAKPMINVTVAIMLILAAFANRILVSLIDVLGTRMSELFQLAHTNYKDSGMRIVKCGDPACPCYFVNTNEIMTSETIDKTHHTN